MRGIEGVICIYCSINSAGIWGMEPYIVRVEADISAGMPYFNMVGLLGSEVREAKERVRTSLKNSGLDIPLGRITINMSPADIRKEGTGFDLPISISLMCIMGLLDYNFLKDFLVIGELSLDGEVKPVRGILPIVNMARKKGIKKIVISKKNLREALIFNDIEIIAIDYIKELLEVKSLNVLIINSNEYKEDIKDMVDKVYTKDNKEDFSDIIGQESVKRVFTIAVAGWHNLLMTGPPGVGKSVLASRIPSIMPSLTMEERIEISEIHSICGLLEDGRLIEKRPFSAPHHTITGTALIGGGKYPRPGELTIAHKGVLFLDEFPEFNQYVINMLRQPLEEKVVKINRNCGSFVFPADCIMVAAMNPCRCGYYPDRNKCNCMINDVRKYLSRVNGPILDRIDLSIEVSRTEYSDLLKDKSNISSSDMLKLVNRATDIQKSRQNGIYNSKLNSEQVKKYCKLDKESSEFMKSAYEKFGLSIRGYFKIIKVARTIADIEGEEEISIEHLMEAMAYRISDQL